MQTSDLAGLAILIVEDEPLLRRQFAAHFQRWGAVPAAAGDLAAARRLLTSQPFDFVFLDINLPDGLGTDLLREKVFSETTGVIVMTAEAGVKGAVEALRLGAIDYLAKPFETDELPLVLTRARRVREAARIEEHRRADEAAPDGFYFGAALADLQKQLEKILAADRRLEKGLPPVLIQGETGTGKTTIARWLHQQGPRAAQPLIEVNCSALPDNLAESELFGHERGAFTDARTARLGLFEAANGGTLFLDELPSLSPALQAKVLTAIEDGRIRRLGAQRNLPVDVRIIAATNQDLAQRVAVGQFREDLYHRLDLFRVALPPLRERGEDILRLADRMLGQLARRHRLPVRVFSPTGREKLLRYRWPGNVRELNHELERALVFEEDLELSFSQLPVPLPAIPPPPGALVQTAESGDWFNEGFVFPPEGFALESALNRLIQHALNQTGQNVSQAARLLGVSRDYVRYRLAGARAGDGTG